MEATNLRKTDDDSRRLVQGQRRKQNEGIQVAAPNQEGESQRVVAARDEDLLVESFEIVCKRIVQVILPVILCSIYVCLLIKLFEINVLIDGKSMNLITKAWFRFGLLPNTMISGDSGVEGSTFTKLLVGNVIIVASFVALIIVITLVILFIFYMEWHGCLNYYFYLPSLIIMLLLTPIFIRQFVLSLGLFSLDYITLTIIMWNFTILGMISIFNVYAKAPLYIQQLYLIHNSAVLAVVIVFGLPNWAAWLLLGFLVVWDLFAVLSPFGPLYLIITMAEREGVLEMPGLVYTTDEVDRSESKRTNPNPSGQKSTAGAGQELKANHTARPDKQEPVADREELRSLPIEFIESDDTKGIPQVEHSPKSIASIVSKPDAEDTPAQAKTIERLQADRLLEMRQQQVNIGPGVVRKEEERPREVSKSGGKKSMQDRGVNIGLGDFIFYGLLIGLTCKGTNLADYQPVLASFSAVIVGLMITLIFLALSRRALPALPISIGMGLAMAALTMHLVPNFANKLAANQVFI